jgi:hypothetical protein
MTDDTSAPARAHFCERLEDDILLVKAQHSRVAQFERMLLRHRSVVERHHRNAVALEI